MKSKALPKIRLLDHRGRKVRVTKAVHDTDVLVLVTFRGTWATMCQDWWREMKRRAHRFEKLGARVIGISSDDPRTLNRFRNQLELPFTLLSDANLVLEDRLGVRVSRQHPWSRFYRKGGFLQPSVFVYTRDGVRRWRWVQSSSWTNLYGASGRPDPKAVVKKVRKAVAAYERSAQRARARAKGPALKGNAGSDGQRGSATAFETAAGGERRRLGAFRDLTAESHAGRTPVLRVEGLRKMYGDFVAVGGLSLSVFPGEVLGFLGPNGAGKTTSISMMCGLLAPTAGRVFLHGQPMSQAMEDRSRVGLCPQKIVVWDRLKCIEQLTFMGTMYGIARDQAERRGHELLDELGLTEKAGALASALSGGMKRRLNIALALVHEPDVVVFDEPEAGLDPQSRVLVREFIIREAQKRAVVLTTHNMDEADRCADRIAIMDRGSVLVVGTPEQLKREIGATEVAEIELQGGIKDKSLVRLCLEPMDVEVSVRGDQVLVEGKNLADVLAPILDALEAIGQRAESVVVRPPTLEDVFLKLTGRFLRD